VAVKIVNACQSGPPFIKDANDGLEKARQGSKLDSFIGMSSSKQNQSSYATTTESFFTANWIDPALSRSKAVKGSHPSARRFQ
jgi:hypothetical protein